MVGTDKGRGWVGKSDLGTDLKGAGYGRFNRNPPHMVFPAAADLKSALPYRAAPLAAVVLLGAGVELHPLDGFARPHERWSTSTECPSLALLPGWPPPTPTPASRRLSVRTLLAKNISQTTPPPSDRESI
jgi:hypothetical protein